MEIKTVTATKVRSKLDKVRKSLHGTKLTDAILADAIKRVCDAIIEDIDEAKSTTQPSEHPFMVERDAEPTD